METYDVAVIGAGPAGITAARDLADRGQTVLLLEARERVGGRTWTRALAGYTGVDIDVGGAYIHTAVQPNLRRELERHGLRASVGVGVPESFCYIDIDGARHAGLPIPGQELPALEAAIVHTANASARIDVGKPVAEQPLSDLDVSMDDFYRRLELPRRTRDFVYGVIANVMQSDVNQVSMLQWLCWMAGTGASPVRTFFGATEERIEGGTGALWSAMLAHESIDLRLGHDVEAFDSDARGIHLQTRAGEEFRARLCVAAVPVMTLDRISIDPELSEGKRTALANPYAMGGFKTFMIVDAPRRAFLGYRAFSSQPEASIGWLFSDRELPDGRQLMMAGGWGEAIDETLAGTQAALRAFLPDAGLIATDGHDWRNDPLAQGILRMPRPGQTMTFASAMTEPEGRLLFAGTEVARTTWNGWIEGALESGHLAAQQAEASCVMSRRLDD